MRPLAPDNICDLNPYQPGLPIDLAAREYGFDPADIIKLASNENPLGMSPKAKLALRQAATEAHRYPEQYALLQALADKYGVDPEMLVIGNGSNDVLDLIARTFLRDGDEAISSQYAFAVYQIATQSAGAKNVVISAKEYGHDLNAIQQAVTSNTKVIWIANPNNPTGTFIPYKAIKQLLKQVPENIIVVLDEAYYEYLSPEDCSNSQFWIDEHLNLIVVRTFSKIYGLAGLRVGYGIMNAAVAELLNRVRQPFNVNSLGIAAATAALEDDDFVRESIELNKKGRVQLQTELTQLGLKHLPAHGNFVTFKISQAASAHQKLLKQGIIVRPLGSYGMPDWMRVTVGRPEENTRFLEAMTAVLRG